MPVSTGSLGEPRAKRCKLCDESNHRSESGSGFWQLQLDRDLVDTISAIYPEWFESNMAEGGPPSTPRESPPKAVIDTSPLHIDQNKESLKVKLMLRRPFDQLVAQGIMPPHKTPAAYHGQRRQLERAKTGDMLKAKIQQRPPRQELERRHILEADPGHVDRSLAERQRMLKKARLADQLNDQLSHRPGPLELIQKNILHTEETIEEAVKTGRIPYKATSEGNLNRPQHPLAYVDPEDDSQSSEGGDALETAAKSAGIVVALVAPPPADLLFPDLCHAVPILASPASLVSSTSTLSPPSSVASPGPPPPLAARSAPPKSDAPGKDKNRKKGKSKTVPKARTIKFHEYKGPPSAHKPSPTTNASGESSYDLLLQQQTLLLQFQLQLQHKFPQIILPASQKNAEPNNNISGVCVSNPLPSPAPSTSSESSNKLSGRLEDMKVSDLKAELKRRNLPVSGPKPQLIERLKPFTNCDHINQNIAFVDSSSADSVIDINSPVGSEHDQMDIVDPLSPIPNQQQLQEHFQQKLQQIQQQDNQQKLSQEEIVREQQRKIEQLQRELKLTQMKFEELTRNEPKAQLIALQKHLQARQQQQQQQQIALQMQQLQALQAKQPQVNEEQQRIQQQQHVAFQNQKNLSSLIIGPNGTYLLNLMQDNKGKNGHVRANSLPSFLNVTPIIADEKALVQEVVKPPPPQYEEATKQIKKNHIKSQTVDDVLEILIKNGELPASAAQDPQTPSTAGSTKVSEPVFPISDDLGLTIDSHELLGSSNLDSVDLMQLMMEVSEGAHEADNNNEEEEDPLAMPMDTDDWLESVCMENGIQSYGGSAPEQGLGFDPLLGNAPEAFDPFDPFNLEEYRSPADLTAALSWDKVDYAA